MGSGSEKRLEVKKIFIGSPGDVIDERHTFRDIVEKVNKIKAKKMGVLLEPLGWEDTLPGKGRPQEKINEDVKQADLVLLVLWKRWGTATGKYSSGFEEEYVVASTERKEVFLYFCDVPDVMLADPGDQLKRVLKFKNKVEGEKKYLYCRYEDEKNFEDLLLEHLCRWLDGFPIIAVHEETGKLAEYEKRIELLEKEAAKSKTQQQKIAYDWAKEAREHAKAGRITEAEEYFAKALGLYSSPSILNNYGLFLLGIGSLRKATTTFNRLLEIGRTTSNQMLVAVAYTNLGIIFYTRDSVKQAEKIYRKALSIYKQLKSKKGIANLYGNLANIHLLRGDLKSAEQMYHRALSLHKELGQKESVATTFSNLGVIYRKRGDFRTAARMYKQALALNKRLRNKEGIASVLGNLGVIYRLIQDLRASENSHKSALKIYRKLRNREGIARNYNGLGSVYRDNHDLKPAEEMFKNALTIYKELGRKLGIARAYDNLGIIKSLRGNLETAESMYNKALKIQEELNDKEGIAVTNGNLGILYKIKGNFKAAEKSYKKTLAIYAYFENEQMIKKTRKLLEELKRNKTKTNSIG